MQITKISSMDFYGLKSAQSRGVKKLAKSANEVKSDFSVYSYGTPTGEIAKETPVVPQKIERTSYYPFGNPTGKNAGCDVSKFDKVNVNDKSHDYISASMMLQK